MLSRGNIFYFLTKSNFLLESTVSMNARVTATTMISFLLKIRVTSISFIDADFIHQELVT